MFTGTQTLDYIVWLEYTTTIIGNVTWESYFHKHYEQCTSALSLTCYDEGLTS